jgi:F-box interacting protein
VTDEYKVVRLFSSSYKGGKLTCCEIFVLGAPLYWRPTAQRPPMFHVKGKNPGVFVGGCLHFLCYGSGIISFNISSETFGAVELPSNPSHASVRMIELDGCLCVITKTLATVMARAIYGC